MTLSSESYRRFAPDDPLVGEAGTELLRSCYLQGHPPTDPCVSPLFADLHAMPESLIVVGEIDPLHDDGVLFARKLQQQGCAAQLLSYRGMPHNFACMPFIDVAQESRAEAKRFHQRLLAPSRASVLSARG
jgi:acetyl esterase/lipase